MEKKLKKIIAFTYPHEAHMAKSFLESHDIEVTLKDELTVQVYDFLSNAVGGVKLFVEESQVDEALRLLESGGYIEMHHPNTEAIEVFPAGYQTKCPYCDSDNVAEKRSAGYVFVASILFLGFPLPFFKKEYFCYNCSKTWQTK